MSTPAVRSTLSPDIISKNVSNGSTAEAPSSRRKLYAVDTFVFLIFCALLALVIIIGNILVVAAYRSNSRLRTKANLFLVSLAASDFLVGLVSLPLWIAVSLLGLESSSVLHIFFISFDMFSALTSVFHLTAISIERYVAISRPFHYNSLLFRNYKYTIAVAWSLSAFIAALYRFAQIYGLINYYVPAVLCVGFLCPLFVIATMYCNIFKIAKSLILRNPGEDISLSVQGRRSSKKTALKKERKVAVTVLIITGLFFIAWLPFYTVLMLAVFCMSCLPPMPTITQIIAFSKWMHYGNSVVNAFVYAFRDREMRRTFGRLIGKRCGGKMCIEVNLEENPSTYM